MTGTPETTNLSIGTDAALAEERAAIFGAGAADAAPAALCLSGGGIRSAAFMLGALQAFAGAGLLREFHYLSTVSGGGYTGALVTVAAHEGVDAATAMLTTPGDPRMRGLRDYTNYLTPTPGIVSGDARAAVLLWLRNTSLNWAVFGPALLALAMLPALYRNLLGGPHWGHWAALGIGLALLFVGTFVACRSLPGHAYRPEAAPGEAPGAPAGIAPRTIRRWVVAPAIGWALLAPMAAVLFVRSGARPFFDDGFLWISGGSAATAVAAYILAGLLPGRSHRAVFVRNFPWWLLTVAAGALLLQLGLWLCAGIDLDAEERTHLVTVLGPLWVIVAHTLQTGLYAGLRAASAYGDLDREWLARLSGDKVVPVAGWTILVAAASAAVVLDPRGTLGGFLSFRDGTLGGAGIVGLVSGPIGAWLGRSAGTLFAPGAAGKAGGGLSRATILNAVLLLAVALFMLVLLVLLGALGTRLIQLVTDAAWAQVPDAWLTSLLALGGVGSLSAILCIAAAFGVGWGFGERINVNRFSLHGVYRNRLVRAFLGSARRPGRRRPDPYTGFDPADNPRMADLWPPAGPRCLFPVVGVTLNLVATRRTAWAERKAAPFTITPLRCGAASLPDGPEPAGVYVPTARYGGGEAEAGAADPGRGLTLGSAMTISGAAASPNMGYHSTTATAFLMTLFNVRLGAWLPNPAVVRPRQLNRSKPTNALLALFDEMTGRSDALSANIYLSDGGHFDNLGLYEMLRRKCRTIVVIDAGEDGGYGYADLGGSLRRAAIDLDAVVTFDAPIDKGKADLDAAGAFATIAYDDGSGGRLLYLKPWLPKGMPADIVAYAAANGRFPHESTANQFFTESQFESYRHLGAHIGAAATAGAPDLAALFGRSAVP